MTNTGKKITMTELAKLADVDISTVSRALNDSPLVKQVTKDKILQLASETGYAVNASARNLRRQSSEAIGIVIPLGKDSDQTITDPFFLEMVGAVSHAASQRGYDLIVSVPNNEAQIAERRLLQTGRADGLIIVGQGGRADRLNELGAMTSKVVVWGGQIGETNYTLVGSDNVGGGRNAVEHLFSLGRRKVLFLGDTSLPEVALRYEGVQQAYAAIGQTHPESLVVPASFGGERAYKLILNWIEGGVEFDSVFASSDLLAMVTIQALQATGRSAPKDVSVIGYDDIGQASLVTPSLSTISQNIKLGGATLVDLLLRSIAGETVQSVLTPTDLIVRESCGGKST